jgi:hypothetical protein
MTAHQAPGSQPGVRWVTNRGTSRQAAWDWDKT